jgi:hypothetical protein
VEEAAYFQHGNFFVVICLTLLHLPPLRLLCVGGCWDRTQDCFDFDIGSQSDALTTQLRLIHYFLSFSLSPWQFCFLFLRVTELKKIRRRERFTMRDKKAKFRKKSAGKLKNGLKVHKNENFFGFDFEFCTISLLVMSKY